VQRWSNNLGSHPHESFEAPGGHGKPERFGAKTGTKKMSQCESSEVVGETTMEKQRALARHSPSATFHTWKGGTQCHYRSTVVPRETRAFLEPVDAVVKCSTAGWRLR